MQTWVIGNWKQNPATSQDVDTLLTDIEQAIGSCAGNDDKTVNCQLMVAPGYVHLAAVSQRLQDTAILCAAQDISAHSATTGAYTGDCSAQQVADACATWTILGHSERRQYHQESHDSLLQKMTNAFTQNLGVVLCIGETQAQYDAKQTIDVLNEQLQVIQTLLEQVSTPQDLAANLSQRLIIAYEPVWAIGTGKVPTVEEVSATHKHIKQKLASYVVDDNDNDNANSNVNHDAESIKVLYGGSVNATNADSFAASPMIDGALVGGAALKADSFMAIATAFGFTAV